ncbi:hypothetical protein HKD26_13990 [Gluconobacter sp. R75629]|nr:MULTISPECIES: hypothetical protein [Acetobacteraceae]MBF0865378.1 hypothetical protein [Gluconobacter sp. R71656]MBF0874867.1 hypothetical protein [Gluconobacter sp. R75629]
MKELHHRDHEDIFVLIDGLKGFLDAIRTAFSETLEQIPFRWNHLNG